MKSYLMKLISTTFCVCLAAPLAHANDISFQALTFTKEGGFDKPTAINLENRPSGRKHATFLNQINFTTKGGTFTNNETGESFPLQSGAAFFASCFSLAKTFGKGKIDAHILTKELRMLNHANAEQFTILAAGNWLDMLTFLEQYSNAAKQNDFKNIPFVSYVRPKRVPDMHGKSPAEIQIALSQLQLEAHKIVSGIFLVAGQLHSANKDPDTGYFFTRAEMPWQNYPELTAHFQLPKGSMAWELGKGGADHADYFQELLPILTYSSVKQAISHGVPLDQAYLVVHAPSVAHATLYQRTYGFQFVVGGPETSNAHHLGILTLDRALQLARYQPRFYSEKVQAVLDGSSRGISDADAIRMLSLIKQLIQVDLDYVAPTVELGSPESKISLYNRSSLFLPAAYSAFESVGIPAVRMNEVIDKLKLNFMSPLDEKNRDVLFAPEQVLDGKLPHRSAFSIQNLSPRLFAQDPLYLEKVLSGVFDYVRQTYAPFANFNLTTTKQNLPFIVYTTDQNMAQKLENMGGQKEQVNVIVPSSPWAATRANYLQVWAVRFSGLQLEKMQPAGPTLIRQGYWQRKDEIEQALMQ